MSKHEATVARENKIYVGGGIGYDPYAYGFESYRWREAILCYLNGLWSKHDPIMYSPRIVFGSHYVWPSGSGWGDLEGGLWLKLNTKNLYTIHGDAFDDFPDSKDVTSDVVSREEVLFANCNNRSGVEIGLIRFVKDDSVRQLWIIQDGSVLCLWKTPRRSELRIGAWNIPTEYF